MKKYEPHTRFKQFKKFVLDQFEAGNVEELNGCKYCNSTGIKHYSDNGRKIPSGNLDLCSGCYGTGLTKLKLKDISAIFICMECNGYGYSMGEMCKKCNGVGNVDWIENILVGGFK